MSAAAQVSTDPLGVRAEFPVAATTTFLNSAYITPTPTPVMAAGRAFADAKGTAPIPLGDMLRKTGEVRAQFAALINASPDEIGFLSVHEESGVEPAELAPACAGDEEKAARDDVHLPDAVPLPATERLRVKEP